jgi:hypothetical protein
MQPALPRRARAPLAWLLIGALAIGCIGQRPGISSGNGTPSDPAATVLPAPTLPVPSPPSRSTPAPTAEPGGTPRPRTVVEINPAVVDRPGVPAALRDHSWWSGADAGSVGTTAWIGIPSGELVLHVADGLVISSASIPAEDFRQDLFVREFETGSLVRHIETTLRGIDARVVGRQLFWTGMATTDADLNEAADGGVWTADLDGGAPVPLVESGTVMDTIFAGRRLLLSPSHRTIAAVMGSYGEGAFVDVLDVETRARDHRLRDVWPWATTDDTFLQWDTQPSDFMAPGSGMSSYDLADGELRWRFPDGDDIDRFAPNPVMALGEDFVVEYYWAGEDGPDQRILAVFDPRTGARRELLRQPNDDRSVLVARADLSTATHVVLEHADRDSADPWLLSTLEIATGTLTTDAFTIDPPHVCDGEVCWRE